MIPRFHTRPGVVLTSICGEYVLVAAKAVRDHVSRFAQLNESSAFLWRLLESGADEEALEKAVMEEYEIEDPVQARSAIQTFIEQMLQIGYLLKEGENNEE